MKKLLLAALLLIPATLVASLCLTAENVNTVYAEILAPFQDSKTQVGVEFSELQHNQDSLEKVSLKAWLYRKGLVNTLDFKVSQLDYDYTDKNNPELKFRGQLDLDMLKVLGQKELNNISAEIEEYVNSFAAEMLEEYGDAAEVQTFVLDKQLDKNGNYQLIKIEINLAVDESKLPSTKPVHKVELSQVSAVFSFTTNGIEADAKLNFNPKYAGYEKDVEGLKRRLELLVNRDSDTMDEIQSFVALGLSYIDDLLNKDRSK